MPIQYSSVNAVVELDEYPKNKLHGGLGAIGEEDEPYSFDEDALEPLLNLEVIMDSDSNQINSKPSS